MDIAVLIPTIYRPAGLRRVLESLDGDPVVKVVAAENDDAEAKAIAIKHGAIFTRCEKYRAGCAYAWNTALQAYPNADAYILASDDCVFMSGWLAETLATLDKLGGSGMVGFNMRKPNPPSPNKTPYHYMMTRDFMIRHHGGVAAVPHYKTWCVDSEAYERARHVGKYAKAEGAFVEHEPIISDDDIGYRMGVERRRESKNIYYKRKRLNFPDDFAPILKA